MPEVAEARGAEQRIGDRVADDVGIGVTGKTGSIGDRHAAENQRSGLRRTR